MIMVMISSFRLKLKINMITEDKQLLFRDLCARLPYGVKVCARFNTGNRYIANVTAISTDRDYIQIRQNDLHPYTNSSIEDIRLYLRPKANMTEEEIKTYRSLQDTAYSYHYEFGDIVDDLLYFDNDISLDYLNSIHIDYRELIEKGLALEAPEDMYKTE